MFPSALVAIDFSPATRSLLNRLNHLAQFGTEKVVLLHVLPKGGDREEALERLETKASKLHQNLETECIVAEGEPGETILATAEERDIPLIVLASRNHSLARRMVLGSVAAEVVRWTTRAVLLEDAHTDGDGPALTGPVLVATDGSPASEPAENLALELARGSSLSVVSVVDDDSLELGYEITSRVLQEAEANGVHVHRSVETGRPGEEIARVAAISRASLIVVGRRRTAERGIGSTAEALCQQAGRPVLLVPKI